MTDMHIHTHFSSDSDEICENYLLAARANGDKAIGFSDHCDGDLFDGDEHALLDVDGYFAELDRAAASFDDIRVLKGVEFGYSQSAERRYTSMLREHKFDYAIMSVHSVPGRGDCYYPEYFDGLDKHQAYELYLNAVLSSVTSSSDFQILGHLGYVARYAPYTDKRLYYGEFAPLIDRILSAVIDRGAAIELNTRASGLDFGIVTPYEILERYIDLGGRLFTFGSDSHKTEHYRNGAETVKSTLYRLGIKSTVRFERGIAVEESL